LKKNQLMMTSNGGGLLMPPGIVENLRALFKAGLNVYAFDAYEYVKIKDKVDEALANGIPGVEIHRYPDEREYSPHNRYTFNTRLFIRVKDISVATVGTHSHLDNHCGAASEPLKEPKQERCAKPFRELSIRWNGDVAICCEDWFGQYKCGNVIKDRIADIWNGEEFMSARRYLYHKNRGGLKPCHVCDARSYRPGLLPDKFGKKVLRKPNEHDAYVVMNAARGKPYTEPVESKAYLIQIDLKGGVR
jgi:radical SAM protein with 4Fe4S-binding SPASM domain